MIMYVVIPVVSVTVFYFARMMRQPPRVWNVLVDPTCMADTVRLVHLISRERVGVVDADTLASRLERIFTTFRPTERTLQRLSIMQQSVAGLGNEEEFCIVLVFTIAMLCACKDAERPKIRRTVSL